MFFKNTNSSQENTPSMDEKITEIEEAISNLRMAMEEILPEDIDLLINTLHGLRDQIRAGQVFVPQDDRYRTNMRIMDLMSLVVTLNDPNEVHCSLFRSIGK